MLLLGVMGKAGVQKRSSIHMARYGVNGLRVVDASTFNFLSLGHTRATVCRCICSASSIFQIPRCWYSTVTEMLAEQLSDKMENGKLAFQFADCFQNIKDTNTLHVRGECTRR